VTTRFLAFYLIGQAKTGISSLELSRHLGVNYDTAWLLHNKIFRAMTEREEAYVLRERSRWMMPTSAENPLAARRSRIGKQVSDRRGALLERGRSPDLHQDQPCRGLQHQGDQRVGQPEPGARQRGSHGWLGMPSGRHQSGVQS